MIVSGFGLLFLAFVAVTLKTRRDALRNYQLAVGEHQSLIRPLDALESPSSEREPQGSISEKKPSTGERFVNELNRRYELDAHNTELIQRQQMAVISNRYAPLIRTLALGDKEVAFRQLLVEKSCLPRELEIAAASLGLDNEKPSSTVAASEIENEIRALLGPEGYSKYSDFEAQLPLRVVVDEFAKQLSFTDHPISADQIEALINLGRVEGVYSAVIQDDPLPEPYVYKAKALLNSEQISALEKMQDSLKERKKLEAILR